MKLIGAETIRGKPGHVRLTFRDPAGREMTRRLGPRGLVSVLEAVTIVKVSRMRIYRMIERGELKARGRKGGVTMLAVGEVLKLAS